MVGNLNGKYHIDFLGTKTDPKFWQGLRPTKAGKIRLSHPTLSDVYFEYLACLLAATVATRPFRVVELGAGWGTWCARAAAMCGRLGIPVHTTAIEGLPGNIANIRKHFFANGLSADCHDIIPAVVSEHGNDVWLRYFIEADIGARVVADDWAARYCPVSQSAPPYGLALPCVDGSLIARHKSKRISDLLAEDLHIDFLHLRIGSRPDKLLQDEAIRSARIGIVVIANMNNEDRERIDALMPGRGYTKLFGLQNGTEIQTTRGPTKVRGHFRVFSGGRVPKKLVSEIKDRFESKVALSSTT